MAVAAEFPDIDTLWSLQGPVAGFTHHRGITHTFLGIPFEAALITAAFYAIHRYREARAKGQASRGRSADPNTPSSGAWPSTLGPSSLGPRSPSLTAAPTRWGLLYAFTLVALLSHLFLDYTNNYGIRPFFPFNPHWYAASIVFIFDPLLFAILLLALGLPSIFRLVNSEIGARKEHFRGRSLAIAALVLIACLYATRFFEHGQAITLANTQTLEVQPPTPAPTSLDAPLPPQPPPAILQPRRILASPDPLSIFRWYAVTDFGPVYQLSTLDTLRNTAIPAQTTQPKPSTDPATRAAEASPLGRAYLDWSPMPWVDTEHLNTAQLDPNTGPGAPATIVTFRDPRFMGDTPILHSGQNSPLTGAVELDPQNQVLAQTMDGRQQKQ